jgi:hypothetical protein
VFRPPFFWDVALRDWVIVLNISTHEDETSSFPGKFGYQLPSAAASHLRSNILVILLRKPVNSQLPGYCVFRHHE